MPSEETIARNWQLWATSLRKPGVLDAVRNHRQAEAWVSQAESQDFQVSLSDWLRSCFLPHSGKTRAYGRDLSEADIKRVLLASVTQAWLPNHLLKCRSCLLNARTPGARSAPATPREAGGQPLGTAFQGLSLPTQVCLGLQLQTSTFPAHTAWFTSRDPLKI